VTFSFDSRSCYRYDDHIQVAVVVAAPEDNEHATDALEEDDADRKSVAEVGKQEPA